MLVGPPNERHGRASKGGTERRLGDSGGRIGGEALHVRPGLASPGSIYNYTHGEALLAGGDPEARYVERLLPFKLALDVVYVRRRSLAYDASIIGRTCVVILGSLVGRRRFPEPPEAPEAARLVREGTT